MAELIDQYRPATYSEIVGQDKALAQLDQWRKRGGFGGRKLLVTGKSGIGKTSLARLIAAECADPTCRIELDDPRAITGDDLAEEFRKLRCRPLFGNGRVLIINEIHLLRKSAITAFLTLTEKGPAGKFAEFATLICTTSAESLKKFEDSDEADSAAFLSRFGSKLPLSQRGIADPFAENCARIARLEGIAPADMTDEELLKKCKRLAQDHGSNHREMLAQIDSGALLAN